MTSAERTRVEQFGQLENGLRQAGDWYLWGPYLSERQWGTVREDYSADGDAWAYLPHDHARSRAYRWGEDGMAGFSDIEQRLCLGLALWNGRDPILKERMFGLTGAEANHGEDVKEYWWYLDAVPSHAWNRWRYHYPQGAFPYDDLLAENGRRGKLDPEYELLDTGVVRRGPLLDLRGRLRQGRPDRPADDGPGHQRRARTPTRCTCCRRCGSATRGRGTSTPTSRSCAARRRRPSPSTTRSSASWSCWPARRPTGPTRSPCSARTRRTPPACSATRPARAYPKDAINDHVVDGADTVNPAHEGTKASLWYQVAGRRRGDRRAAPAAAPDGRQAGEGRRRRSGSDFEKVVATRRKEADEFYAELTPPDATADEAMVMRQAFSGMLWSKQLFDYDVARWLEGDPTQPTPPASPADRPQLAVEELRGLRHHVDARQVGVPVVRGVGPRLPLRRPRPPRPGVRQVPAAADLPGVVPAPQRRPARLRVGLRRRQPARAGLGRARGLRHRRRPRPRLPQQGLRQAARQLHVVGQPRGRRRLEPVRGRVPRPRQHRAARPLPPARSAAASSSPTPPAGWRSTRWPWPASPPSSTARASARPPTSCSSSSSTSPSMSQAMKDLGVWDETDGLYYDKLITPDGTEVPVKVRSMVGIIPLLAAVVVDEGVIARSETVGKQFARLLDDRGIGERGGAGRSRPPARRARRPQAAARRRRHRPPAAAVRQALRRGRVPLAVRAAGRVGLPPRAPLRARRRGHHGDDRLRAGRVDDGRCSAATPTGGARCGSRSTTSSSARSTATTASSATSFTVEYPTGSGHDADARQDRRGPPRAAGRRCSSSAPTGGGRRSAMVERLQEDPAWKDNIVVQRVLPRRQRRRARRHAPDGLDRRRRRPHPRPPGRRRVRRRRDRPASWPTAGQAMTLTAERRRTDGLPSAAARPARAARRHAAGRRHQLRRGLRASPTGWCCACSTPPGRETQVPMRRLRRRRVARLRPRRRARARPTGSACSGAFDPARGVRMQPGQAAARPVRPGHHRRGDVRARGARRRRRRSRPRPARSTRRRHVPRSLVVDPAFDWDDAARPSINYADSVIYEVHVKGFTMTHPGVPDGAARHVRRPRPPGGHRPPRRPRRHDGAAAPGPPARARVVPGRAGPDELLGLQHDRLLRPPRRLLGGGPHHARRPGRRVQGDGRRRCTPPGSRSSSTSSTTTPPRPAPTARRCATAGSTTPAYYRLDPSDPQPLRRHHRLRQLAERRATRSGCS